MGMLKLLDLVIDSKKSVSRKILLPRWIRRIVLQGVCAKDTSVEDGRNFFKPSSMGKKGWLSQVVPEGSGKLA